jgi:predicted nucleic-acid-binding protein
MREGLKSNILQYLNKVADHLFEDVDTMESGFVELIKVIRFQRKEDNLSEEAITEVINEILNEKVLNDYQEHVLLDANLFLNSPDKFGLF